MAVIFSDDINDNRGEDLSKRVDTLYDYINYMKEQLEFWGKNRTKELNDASTKLKNLNDRVNELEGGN